MMRISILAGILLLSVWTNAQSPVFPAKQLPLDNLNAFQSPPANWKIVGDAYADPDKQLDLQTRSGTGVLVNLPDGKNAGNLLFGFEHGDLDLELEVMMAPHSNSGIYLQGRYEIQLLDSWGKKRATKGDIAAVYERWDEARPEGQKGYEGIAPRVNVARAPGLWQTLRIEFQAPRFDANGKKTSNARLIRVTLNGVIVHENIELTGPTRGQAFPGEAALGPILLQGDHGPVAFRNIRYRAYQQQALALKDLKYKAYTGEFEYIPDFSKISPVASGPATSLNWSYARGTNDFALQFTGVFDAPDDGQYEFTLTSFANGQLIVNGDTIIKQAWWTRSGSIQLKKGPAKIEIAYCKAADWLPPALGLFVEGATFRQQALHAPSSLVMGDPTDPILLQPGAEPEMLRSFIDIPSADGKSSRRIVHPISVGFPQGAHFSYDLDNGALFQVWKGDFLDVTPMWNDRGDGHADPMGSVLLLGDRPALLASDTLPSGAAYHYLGYKLDTEGVPTFRYSWQGQEVTDRIMPDIEGKYLIRKLQFPEKSSGMVYLAKSAKIEQITDDLWAIDDHRYFLRLSAKSKARVQTEAGNQYLVAPASGAVEYQLIW